MPSYKPLPATPPNSPTRAILPSSGAAPPSVPWAIQGTQGLGANNGRLLVYPGDGAWAPVYGWWVTYYSSGGLPTLASIACKVITQRVSRIYHTIVS